MFQLGQLKKIKDEKVHFLIYQIAYMDTMAEFGIYVIPESAPTYTTTSCNFKYGNKEKGWPSKEDIDFIKSNFCLYCNTVTNIYNLYASDSKVLRQIRKFKNI